jgi:MFS family permease
MLIMGKTFQIDSDRLGLFALFPAIGALIGQIGVAGFFNRTFGRKRTFHIATALVVFGVILQTFTDNWRMHRFVLLLEFDKADHLAAAVLAGRIIMGLGGDTNGLVLGYYVTEITPKHVRGRALIFVQQFMSSFLGIAGSWIAYGKHNHLNVKDLLG